MDNRVTRGDALVGALSVGGGNTIYKVNHGTVNLVHGTILPGRLGTITATLAGLSEGDGLQLMMPTAPTNGIILAGCSPASGSLFAFLGNITSGTIAPGTVSTPYVHTDLTP